MEFKGPRRWRCPDHGTWADNQEHRDWHAKYALHANFVAWETWDRCAVCSAWVRVADAKQHVCAEAQGPSLTGLVFALLGVVAVVLGAAWLLGGGR